MNCTWKDCTKEATRPQLGRDGKTWASLCDEHDQKVKDAIASDSAPKIIGAWINAQGGAKKAAQRTMEGA